MVSFHRSATAEVEAEETQEVAALPSPQSAAAFPRVNLMPEVVAAEARSHRAKTIMIGATVASVAVVGGLFLMAHGAVNEAQDSLDAAQAQTASLNSEMAKYADVPKVQAMVSNARTQAFDAMGSEVRWSVLLNNLSMTIPAGTSLISFQGTVSDQPPATAAAKATATTPGSQQQSFISALGHGGIGTITYTGEAVSYPAVAKFLDSQAKQVSLIDPYVNSVATAGTDGASDAKGVQFTATSTITDKALSHRYDLKAGE
jgi:Tfp pilus assembly protein PilN